MTVQDVLELHRAGWSRDEVLAMMLQEQPKEPQQMPEPQQPQQPQPEQPQQVPQEQPQQVPQEQPQQVQQEQPQQESETVQLLREMLGMIRGNNINTMAGETRTVDAAEILAANDYGFDKGGKN